MRIRIKCTDKLRNVAYVHNTGGSWRCNLANGIPASLSYAGVRGDEMAALFALDDAQHEDDALAAMIKHGSQHFNYEVV
jgi:hypothetical protein